MLAVAVFTIYNLVYNFYVIFSCSHIFCYIGLYFYLLYFYFFFLNNCSCWYYDLWCRYFADLMKAADIVIPVVLIKKKYSCLLGKTTFIKVTSTQTCISSYNVYYILNIK